MPIEKSKSNDEDIPTHTEAYYEEVASQEEVYLEETEEELRAILIFDDSSLSPDCRAENLDEQRGYAAEELITGDSDDPPLNEEAVVEMLGVTVNVQRRRPSRSVSLRWRCRQKSIGLIGLYRAAKATQWLCSGASCAYGAPRISALLMVLTLLTASSPDE